MYEKLKENVDWPFISCFVGQKDLSFDLKVSKERKSL
jgi:hypothetical protein